MSIRIIRGRCCTALRRRDWQQTITVTLRALRSSLFVSERQFRRRCEAATGLAPKALQRMLRFQGFLARVQFALIRGLSPATAGLGRLAGRLSRKRGSWGLARETSSGW